MFASIAAAVQRHRLVAFIVLAYAITWAVTGPLVAHAEGWLDTGVPDALHYLAQFGPMLAALAITAVCDGRAGLRELAGRATRWRTGAGWLLVAAASPVALYALAAVITRVADGAWPDLPRLGEVNFLPYLGLWALPLWLATNGVGEELGWRGFALPRL
jgi:membrane protease YdiL (CAAX protease family)